MYVLGGGGVYANLRRNLKAETRFWQEEGVILLVPHFGHGRVLTVQEENHVIVRVTSYEYSNTDACV